MAARALAELPPSSWEKNPNYGMELPLLPVRLRAEFAGEPLFDTTKARVMYELGHEPVYYVPRDELRADLLVATDHVTHCPYKGDASYWSIMVGDNVAENAVWCYDDPYPEMAALKDLYGIYWDRVDAWYHDGARAERPLEIAGRVNAANNFAKSYPSLAAEWHRERNARIQPYEFAAESDVAVWWRNGAGEEWQEPIRDRVLRFVGTGG